MRRDIWFFSSQLKVFCIKKSTLWHPRQTGFSDWYTFSSWSDEIARIIYPSFARLHQSGTSSVWNPPLEYDSKKLESVQRRATLRKESHHLKYEERLQRVGLTNLKKRRVGDEVVQIYKLVHGLEKVNCCDENKKVKPDQNTVITPNLSPNCIQAWQFVFALRCFNDKFNAFFQMRCFALFFSTQTNHWFF